jgi:ribonuclease Z
LIHSRLINPPFGDPGVYLEFMFERRRMLFDLGDLQPLSDRQLLRVSHIFVSHSHMDHFAGFDRMIRILLGRDRTLHLFGPQGFIERVWHRLASYTWNLVGNFKTDLVLAVGEYAGGGEVTRARLSCRGAFEVEPLDPLPTPNGILVDLPDYRVRAAVLDHGIPCLGFAVEQKRHVNIWKNKVEEMGFRVGPWLRELKQAILRDDPADTAFRVHWRDAGGGAQETVHPLGELRDRLTDIVPGQKIAYVTDVRWSDSNRAAIVELARGSDLLYIEAAFLDADAALAAAKNHLTAAQAGRLAREAGVKRMSPFHFSPRYSDRAADLWREAEAHFGAQVGTVAE